MNQLTRRQFIRGLLAAAGTAAVLGPRALVEKVHGASDLTPQERDIAAEVMGLRKPQWSGFDLTFGNPPFHPNCRHMTFPILDERHGFGQLTVPVYQGPSGHLVPPDIRDKVLFALGHPSRVTITQHVIARQVVARWVWKGTSEHGAFWDSGITRAVLD